MKPRLGAASSNKQEFYFSADSLGLPINYRSYPFALELELALHRYTPY